MKSFLTFFKKKEEKSHFASVYISIGIYISSVFFNYKKEENLYDKYAYISGTKTTVKTG